MRAWKNGRPLGGALLLQCGWGVNESKERLHRIVVVCSAILMPTTRSRYNRGSIFEVANVHFQVVFDLNYTGFNRRPSSDFVHWFTCTGDRVLLDSLGLPKIKMRLEKLSGPVQLSMHNILPNIPSHIGNILWFTIRAL